MQDWIIEIKKPFEESLIQKGAIIVDANGSLEDTQQRVLKVVSN
jgi:dephospho-CoA kinase